MCPIIRHIFIKRRTLYFHVNVGSLKWNITLPQTRTEQTLRTFAKCTCGRHYSLYTPPFCKNCTWTQRTFHILHSESMWTQKSYSWLSPKPEKDQPLQLGISRELYDLLSLQKDAECIPHSNTIFSVVWKYISIFSPLKIMFYLLKYFSYVLNLAKYPTSTSTECPVPGTESNCPVLVTFSSLCQIITQKCTWRKHLKILYSEIVAEINSALTSITSWFKNQANKFKQIQCHITVMHMLKTSITTHEIY